MKDSRHPHHHYETDEGIVLRARRRFWGLTALLTAAAALLALVPHDGPWSAAITIIYIWVVMLSTARGTAIGIRTHPFGVIVITLISRREYPWNRVRVLRWPFKFFGCYATLRVSRLFGGFLIYSGGKEGPRMVSALERWCA